MTRVNMSEIKKPLEELLSNKTLKGFVISELSKVVTVDIEELLEKQSFDKLPDNEIVSIFECLYKLTNKEEFNPKKLDSDLEEENQSKDTYAERIYNWEFKEQFLNDSNYKEKTKRVIRVLFAKLSELEEYNEQDIYEFNRQTFEECLKTLKATTIRSLQNSISKLEKYIEYAIEKGKAKVNVASRYGKREDIEQFLDEEAEDGMIFTKKEIDYMSMDAMNSQDGVILSLIFDGVSHKRKFLELRNITIENVDFDNKVINIPELIDEENGEVLPPRQVPVSTETLIMIKRAMDLDEKYVSINKDGAQRKYKIAKSNYIIRGLRNNFQIKWENIGQRILRIAEFNNERFLNATNIGYSGQVHYALELMDSGVDIDDACKAIMNRFDMNDNESVFFYLKARIEKYMNKKMK